MRTIFLVIRYVSVLEFCLKKKTEIKLSVNQMLIVLSYKIDVDSIAQIIWSLEYAYFSSYWNVWAQLKALLKHKKVQNFSETHKKETLRLLGSFSQEKIIWM